MKVGKLYSKHKREIARNRVVPRSKLSRQEKRQRSYMRQRTMFEIRENIEAAYAYSLDIGKYAFGGGFDTGFIRYYYLPDTVAKKHFFDYYLGVNFINEMQGFPLERLQSRLRDAEYARREYREQYQSRCSKRKFKIIAAMAILAIPLYFWFK